MITRNVHNNLLFVFTRKYIFFLLPKVNLFVNMSIGNKDILSFFGLDMSGYFEEHVLYINYLSLFQITVVIFYIIAIITMFSCVATLFILFKVVLIQPKYCQSKKNYLRSSRYESDDEIMSNGSACDEVIYSTQPVTYHNTKNTINKQCDYQPILPQNYSYDY